MLRILSNLRKVFIFILLLALFSAKPILAENPPAIKLSSGLEFSKIVFREGKVDWGLTVSKGLSDKAKRVIGDIEGLDEKIYSKKLKASSLNLLPRKKKNLFDIEFKAIDNVGIKYEFLLPKINLKKKRKLYLFAKLPIKVTKGEDTLVFDIRRCGLGFIEFEKNKETLAKQMKIHMGSCYKDPAIKKVIGGAVLEAIFDFND